MCYPFWQKITKCAGAAAGGGEQQLFRDADRDAPPTVELLYACAAPRTANWEAQTEPSIPEAHPLRLLNLCSAYVAGASL